MMRPLSVYIGFRYTRAKRRNHFISFIAFASMLGIAVGVMVLITVLSVMNGFDYQIRKRFFAIAPQVTILTRQDITQSWPQLKQKAMKIPGVVSAAPYVSGKGIMIGAGDVAGVETVGIVPQQERSISELAEKITAGDIDSLAPGQFKIIIGQALASQLNLSIGDKINLFTPQSNITIAGVFPRYKPFTVSGIFHTSDGFGFDSSIVYIHMQDAQRLFGTQQSTSGLHVKLKNLYAAGEVTQQLMRQLPQQYAVTNWMESFGSFFQAFVMEKTILFVILLLIVAVAVFNLVSTLVMVVNDKRADIAILRTIGASPGMVLRTILVQGAIIGLVGTILGLIAGVILALNVTRIADAVQRLFHVQFLKSSVFFIDFLPSQIHISDIVIVCCISLLLSILATLYPAWMAFKTQPAEALRYE